MSGFEPVFFLFCRHFSLFPAVLPVSGTLFSPQTMFVGAANAFSPQPSALLHQPSTLQSVTFF
jgi:hypothetical protein